MPAESANTFHPKLSKIRRAISYFFLFCLLLPVPALAWILFLPPPIQPNLTIHLHGYRINQHGVPIAIISLTNDSPTTVFAYMPLAFIQRGTNFPEYAILDRPPLAAKLSPAQSTTFSMPSPTNQPWKLSLYVYNDFDLPHTLKIRLTSRRQMPFGIRSDWFPAPPSPVIAKAAD